jgi:hypothetical protein
MHLMIQRILHWYIWHIKDMKFVIGFKYFKSGNSFHKFLCHICTRLRSSTWLYSNWWMCDGVSYHKPWLCTLFNKCSCISCHYLRYILTEECFSCILIFFALYRCIFKHIRCCCCCFYLRLCELVDYMSYSSQCVNIVFSAANMAVKKWGNISF